MKKINTFGIQFVIRKHRIKDDKAPIYARVTVNRERAEISIKKRIHVDNWNNGRGMAKGKSSEIGKLNSYLEQIRSQLTECYQELVINKEIVTPEAIKNKFLGVEDSGETLKGLVEYHNTGMDSNLRWGTLKNYKTTEKYIEKFLTQKFKRNDIYLVELNYKFITDFEHFLRKYQPEDHHLPMGNNTVMKHIERLRKMTNLAVRLGWLDKDPFVAYRLSFKRVEREFLTQLELDTIKKKQFKIERLQYVKDLFVFSCYTGLSYIDVMNLKPNNIRIGIDRMTWIITQREKTTTPVRIPILSLAQVLIDKYKDHPRSVNKGTIFPNISNQKLNSYLKEIADVCEIDKNLTFHVARHTFATTVTLTNGVPIESVSKMLGHTDLKTTQIYAKVVEKKISDDMANLEEKLSGKRSKKRKSK
ncbi:site-specific integrase [uncultured Draconibacterium sp.]|uniref:site-specific integrase n=1 Tax=uncultured Draconibacterium sp. TaxID=1573823 RepID=UPI002628E7ED|nr:site-specific integrase [uncultured Draconibacterium sp.]